MIALREGVTLKMGGNGDGNGNDDAEVAREVDRLIRDYGLSGDSWQVREHLTRRVLRERGLLPLEKSRLQRARVPRLPKAPRWEAEDSFAKVAEATIQRADAERREKRRSRASRPRAIPYDFAPVPEVWYQIARHFPAKADRLIVVLCCYWWRFKWACFPTIRSLSARTGYSRQTIQDLLTAFEWCAILRKGKRPSGSREVKQRNIYHFRPVRAWDTKRAERVQTYLREVRGARKARVPEKAAVG